MSNSRYFIIMETLIVICLFIVIALLLQDKIVIKRKTKRKEQQESSILKLPDIMVQSKPLERHPLPTKAIESQKKKSEDRKDNFDTETKEKDFAKVIPQEELDEVFNVTPDLEEEEEEWHNSGKPNGEDGFATGVTFEELAVIGTLLQQEKLEPSIQKRAANTVHKIQGTELFSLLENSIENASQKIAWLLDRSINQRGNSGSSTMRNKGLDGFDIREFV